MNQELPVLLAMWLIFPADAGVNLLMLVFDYSNKDIPRGCGGEPAVEL